MSMILKITPIEKWIKNKKAISPAISTAILTATTIILVLIASNYAYQNLERNRGAAEFSTAKKAMLVIDDAIENIAWKTQSSRSTHLIANYGTLDLIPNALNLTVTAQAGSNLQSLSLLNGIIRYYTRIDYVNYGNDYKEYILGDNKTIITRGSDSFGQALIEQQSQWISITLTYRVCAMITREEIVDNTHVTYVDIYIINVTAPKMSNYKGEFDLVTRCVSVETPLSVQFDVAQGMTATVTATLGELSGSWTTQPLNEGKVVFNFIVSTVEVYA